MSEQFYKEAKHNINKYRKQIAKLEAKCGEWDMLLKTPAAKALTSARRELTFWEIALHSN